jgi:putative endonuclease
MWSVYLARCADGTLYCGITNDLAARVAAHNAGKGAKYTRRRGPIELVFKRGCRAKGTALRLEYAIKQLTRAQKQALIAEPRRFAALVRAVRAVRH